MPNAPSSYRLREWAMDIVNGDAILCDIGNSLVSDNASTPTLGRGVQRCWHPRLGWSGRGSRVVTGPGVWSSNTAQGGVGTVAYNSKSATWVGAAEVGIFPITYTSLQSTHSFDYGGSAAIRNDLQDLRKAATDSGYFAWADGVHMRARMLVHVSPTATGNANGNAGTGMLRLAGRPRRGGVASGAFANEATTTGTAGTTFVEVDLPAAAGAPGIEVGPPPGAPCIDKWAAFGGVMYYKADASNNRVPGLVYYDAATGGDKSTDVISQFDGTVVPKKYMAGYFEAMGPGGQWPTHIRLYAPTQNEHSAENADFALGTYGVAKANIIAIIDAINALYDLYGKPRPKILIDSGHQTGYTNAKTILKELACYEAAQERNCHYMSTFQISPQNPSEVGAATFYTNPAASGDAVHFGPADTTEAQGNGEVIMAAAQWAALVTSVDAPTRPRIAQYAA